MGCYSKTYFVEIKIDNDTNYAKGRIYYPLFLNKESAYNANDTKTDVVDDNITKFTFTEYPDIDFWMPNNIENKSVGGVFIPPISFEYIEFTNSVKAECFPVSDSDS